MCAALPLLKCLLVVALLPGLLNGCSDYSRSLPNGYTLEKTNNSTRTPKCIASCTLCLYLYLLTLSLSL
ncbi:MAG: hypothetical protein ACLFU8_11415 [Anaerolineales bacterium]